MNRYEPEWDADFDANGNVVVCGNRGIVLPKGAAWAVANLLRPPVRTVSKPVVWPHPHARQDSEYDRQRRADP